MHLIALLIKIPVSGSEVSVEKKFPLTSYFGTTYTDAVLKRNKNTLFECLNGPQIACMSLCD